MINSERGETFMRRISHSLLPLFYVFLYFLYFFPLSFIFFIFSFEKKRSRIESPPFTFFPFHQLHEATTKAKKKKHQIRPFFALPKIITFEQRKKKKRVNTVLSFFSSVDVVVCTSVSLLMGRFFTALSASAFQVRQSTFVIGCVRRSVGWSVDNAFVRRSTCRTLLAILHHFKLF